MDTKYELLDLYMYVDTAYFNSRVENQDYGAGDQLLLLRDAFDFKWIVTSMRIGAYDGDWEAIFELSALEGKFIALEGGYGSCAGCDYLEAHGAKEWLKEHLKCVRVFDNLKDLKEWIEYKKWMVTFNPETWEMM